jgi:cytochrome c553
MGQLQVAGNPGGLALTYPATICASGRNAGGGSITGRRGGVPPVKASRLCATGAFLLLAAAAALLPGGVHAQGDVARGQVLAHTCLGCHGIEGYRNAFPAYRVPKLGGQHEESIYLSLVEYAQRRRSHPTMYVQAATMSDQDKRDIAAYFGAYGEPRTGRPATGARIERGREKSAVCAACHGQTGVSANPEWPNLAGQHESYLYQSLRQYSTGERQNAIMAGQVMALSEEDMRDLAAFYAAQPGLFTTRSRDF